ncbi:MAG: class I SAM-dependent RNA methyltransferase [Alphaproteobacteria bacterium]|nr:class I SAM-dependent RNA methyltransferase [Alphaproteobacteria bacterium]
MRKIRRCPRIPSRNAGLFGTCGGCTLQNLAPDAYLEHKRKLIGDALARYGIPSAPLREMIRVPPRSRRRATLKLEKRDGVTRIGFYAPRSHVLVDIQECHVLTPGLFRLAERLRERLHGMLRGAESADLYIAEAENGFDLSIQWKGQTTPDLIGQFAAAAPALDLIRITAGGDLLFQSAMPEVHFGKAKVRLPPGAFLQPTRDGEAMLQATAIKAVGKAKGVVDLFCGCGTFALPLGERTKVHAVDSEAPMLSALSEAARATPGLKPVTAERRDLFRHPIGAAELNAFDAAVLDPPRAGALAQAGPLAKSNVRRIAYVSCDAASFARDARVLMDGGYRLDWILGVDQFLWSPHIELAAAFAKD